MALEQYRVVYTREGLKHARDLLRFARQSERLQEHAQRGVEVQSCMWAIRLQRDCELNTRCERECKKGIHGV